MIEDRNSLTNSFVGEVFLVQSLHEFRLLKALQFQVRDIADICEEEDDLSIDNFLQLDMYTPAEVECLKRWASHGYKVAVEAQPASGIWDYCLPISPEGVYFSENNMKRVEGYYLPPNFYIVFQR